MQWTRVVLFLTLCGSCDTACPDPADVVKINSIAKDISALGANLPEHDFSNATVVVVYNNVLNALCTTYKPQLYNISSLLASCPANAQQASDLLTLQFLGKGFLQLYANFADVDEFCACHPYLVSAWRMSEFRAENYIENLKGFEVAKLHCNTSFLPSVVANLAVGQAMCRPLYKEATMSSARLVFDTKGFIDTHCNRNIDGMLQCIENVTGSEAFKSCTSATVNSASLSNYTTSGSSLCDTSCCGMRDCIVKHVEPRCGATARTLSIDIVNLIRTKEVYVASPKACNTSGGNVARMSIMAALGIPLLYLVL